VAVSTGQAGDRDAGDAPAAPTFARAYPAIARWVEAYGWIEVGHDDVSRSVVRALDVGGLAWEGEATYPTLDDALRALDAALAQWLREQVREEARPR
jgi:hypothetical protein